jgi:hypothetical protein
MHRPYGTPGGGLQAAFPTLKRGANLHCAYGAGSFETTMAWISRQLLRELAEEKSNADGDVRIPAGKDAGATPFG